MTRQIKFRAWDKAYEEMFYSDDGRGFQFELSPFSGNEITDLKGNGFPDREWSSWMQFTGLLDKNGTPIYEGDIIVRDGYVCFDVGIPNYRGTVEWGYSRWQVILHCINPSKNGISDGINYGLNDEGIEDGKPTAWEVIGNIYENPDLL